MGSMGHNRKWEEKFRGLVEGRNEITERTKENAKEVIRQGKLERLYWDKDQIGRALVDLRGNYPSDEEFGKTVCKIFSRFLHTDWFNRPYRSACMWAYNNPEAFEELRKKFPECLSIHMLHKHSKVTQEPKKSKRKPPTNGNKPDEDDTDDDVVDNGDEDTPDEDTPDTGKGKPKKAKPINSPPYSIQEAVGAIQSLSQVYVREYTGTDEEAADILFSEIVKGCEQGSINMSISRDRIKWVLKWKKMLDLAEPRMREFLKEEPKLNVVK